MKSVALVLIAVLFFQASAFPLPADSAAAQSKQARQAAKAKFEVQRRGVGEKSRVRVTLHDGSELKGYISKIEDDSFSLTDPRSGRVDTVSYSEVMSVKGPGLAKAAEVLIGIGLVAAVVGIIFVAIYPKT